MDWKTVSFAPSHRLPDGGVLTQLCFNTSSTSSNQAFTFEHATANFGYTSETYERCSLQHFPTKQKAPVDKANSGDDIFDNSICDNLEDWPAFSSFSQKPTYRVLISVGINSVTQRTVVSLLDTVAGPKPRQQLIPPTKLACTGYAR